MGECATGMARRTRARAGGAQCQGWAEHQGKGKGVTFMQCPPLRLALIHPIALKPCSSSEEGPSLCGSKNWDSAGWRTCRGHAAGRWQVLDASPGLLHCQALTNLPWEALSSEEGQMIVMCREFEKSRHSIYSSLLKPNAMSVSWDHKHE